MPPDVLAPTTVPMRQPAGSKKIEVAISIIGSAVTSSELRNNASRVAFPPTNCAVTDAAQHMAMRVERALDVMLWR